MLTTPRKLVTTALLCVSLGLAGLGVTTTPARADNAEAAAVVGGLIALLAIASAIDNRNDRDDRPRVTIPHHGHNPVIHPINPRRLVAPERCRREFQTRNGTFRGYNRRCMQHHARYAHLLPDNCLRQVRTERGIRYFYGGRCLHRNGWVRG